MGKYIKIRVCMAVLPNKNNKFCQLHCIKNIKKPAQIKKEYRLSLFNIEVKYQHCWVIIFYSKSTLDYFSDIF